jgi:hypothetical protein
MSNLVYLTKNIRERIKNAYLDRHELRIQFLKARDILYELRRRQLELDDHIAKLKARLDQVTDDK